MNLLKRWIFYSIWCESKIRKQNWGKS